MYLVLASFIAAVAYRIRGGGWFTFNSNTICRLIWGLGLMIAYVLLNLGHINKVFFCVLPLLAWLQMLVPHAFAQNMGSWPTPQKRWPAFFLPTISNVQWTDFPMWVRTMYDFGGMAGVGFFRGLFTFGAYFGYEAATGNFAVYPHCLCALGAITLGQPIAYLVGKYFPLTVTSSLKSFSAEWGEFFNGAAWAIALAAL